MKTIKQVEATMKGYLDEISDLKLKLQRTSDTKEFKSIERQIKRVHDSYDHWKTIRAYLQTNPSEDYIKAEAKRITGRLNAIEAQAQTNSGRRGGQAYKFALAEVEKLYDAKKLRSQLQTLTLILNN